MNDTTATMWKLYTEKKMSLQEVAKCFNISKQAVHYRFKKSGLSCRSTWSARPILSVDIEQKIVNLYTDFKQSGVQIARSFKLSEGMVYDILHDNGIKPKVHNRYSREIARQCSTPCEIRNRLGCSRATSYRIYNELFNEGLVQGRGC